MCEPLTGKKFMFHECGEEAGISDVKKLPVQYDTMEVFSKEDVKSAVEGFLKEVIRQGTFENDKIHTTETKWLVKKWFEDVIE